LPSDLAAVCMKAIAKGVGDRYATTAAFAEDLQRWLSGQPVQAHPIGRATRLVRWTRQEPVLATLGALVAVLALASTITAVNLSIARHRMQITQAELETNQRDLKESLTRHSELTTQAQESADLAKNQKRQAEESLARFEEEQNAKEKLAKQRETLLAENKVLETSGNSTRNELSATRNELSAITSQVDFLKDVSGKETWKAYIANLKLAERTFLAGDADLAEEQLEACPLEHRAWEWHVLKNEISGASSFNEPRLALEFSDDKSYALSPNLQYLVTLGGTTKNSKKSFELHRISDQSPNVETNVNLPQGELATSSSYKYSRLDISGNYLLLKHNDTVLLHDLHEQKLRFRSGFFLRANSSKGKYKLSISDVFWDSGGTNLFAITSRAGRQFFINGTDKWEPQLVFDISQEQELEKGASYRLLAPPLIGKNRVVLIYELVWLSWQRNSLHHKDSSEIIDRHLSNKFLLVSWHSPLSRIGESKPTVKALPQEWFSNSPDLRKWRNGDKENLRYIRNTFRRMSSANIAVDSESRLLAISFKSPNHVGSNSDHEESGQLVVIIDLENNTTKSLRLSDPSPYRSIGFSPDSRRLIAFNDGGIRLWNVQSGIELPRLNILRWPDLGFRWPDLGDWNFYDDTNTFYPYPVKMSSDSKTLLRVANNGRLYVWNMDSLGQPNVNSEK